MPPPQLHATAILAEAFRISRANWRPYVRLAAIPWMLSIAFGWLANYWRSALPPEPGDASFGIWGVVSIGISWIGYIVIIVPVVVAWHRFVIIGGGMDASWLRFRLDRSVLNYSFVAVIMALLTVAMSIIAFLPQIIDLFAVLSALHLGIVVPVIPVWVHYSWMFLCLIGAFLIPIPFLLALPAASVRDHSGLFAAFRLLRGNLATLALVVIAVLMIWLLLSSPMYVLAFMGTTSPLAPAWGSLVEFATLPLWASVLSLIYLRLRSA